MPMAMRRLAEISIHPPRVGRDVAGKAGAKAAVISIRPPREGRDPSGALPVDLLRISIHPPCVGRDTGHASTMPSWTDFNPLSPCGEGLSCTLTPLGMW